MPLALLGSRPRSALTALDRLAAACALAALAALILGGCCADDATGPPSTQTRSDAGWSLDEKIRFVERYVTFRRQYLALDFDIEFHGGEGLAPGPSEWDVRLVALVPESDLDAWIPEGASPGAIDTRWTETLPAGIDRRGVSAWYSKGGVVVGVDRKASVVVYRNVAR